MCSIQRKGRPISGRAASAVHAVARRRNVCHFASEWRPRRPTYLTPRRRYRISLYTEISEIACDIWTNAYYYYYNSFVLYFVHIILLYYCMACHALAQAKTLSSAVARDLISDKTLLRKYRYCALYHYIIPT